MPHAFDIKSGETSVSRGKTILVYVLMDSSLWIETIHLNYPKGTKIFRESGYSPAAAHFML